jgi:diketogulonate reductase-like aldo/keto reductase
MDLLAVAKSLILVVLLACFSVQGFPSDYPVVPMRGIHGQIGMPLVGIGTWEYNDTVAEASVLTAFGLGYRHVDTAFVYKNQVGVGSALKKSGIRRQDYFVTSKVPGGLNSSATTAALDKCLQDLQLSSVDLMLLHFPVGSTADVQQQWLALERWAKAGHARAIGVSHFCKTHVQAVLDVATLPIAINQNQYHVGMAQDSEPRLHDKRFSESKGILWESYSSLCGPCPPPQNMELISGDLVVGIGQRHNKTGAQVALRWLVQQGIPVIPKSSSPKHIKSNFELFDFKLSPEDMVRLSSATSPPETGTPQAPDDAQDCSAEEPSVHV